MIVYHGTDSYSAQNIMEAGIDLARGEESVDNARGFYTTPSREFALRRARMTTAAVGKFRKDATLRPAVLEIEIDGDVLKKLNVLEFTGTTYQWKEFVFYNRAGKRFLRSQGIVSSNHNLDLVYDVVIDETADAGVGGLVSNFRYKETRGGIDLRTAINKVQRSNSSTWGRQMSFHTSRAVKMCIKWLRSVDV